MLHAPYLLSLCTTQTRNWKSFETISVTLSLPLSSHQSSNRSTIFVRLFVLDIRFQVQLSHSVWIVSSRNLTKGPSDKSGAFSRSGAESDRVPATERDVATYWLWVHTSSLPP